MKRLIPFMVAVLALVELSGCANEKPSAETAKPAARPVDTRYRSSLGATQAGKQLMAYAPETDFTGAAPENVGRQASALFDGALTRDAVSSNGYVPAASLAGGRKRLPYTAAAGERVSDLRGVEPPLPDDYDYSKSGATPGTAKGAGQTLLGFAKFQLDQGFATVAPVMSRLGWGASARRGSNVHQTPYRVTVHHTDGHRATNEAEAKRDVKGTQWYHMVGRGQEGKDNFSDIGYHFLIAGDGRVIEGRQAEYVGAHVLGDNDGNIGVAMMGDYNKLKPTDAQVESLTRLVTYLAIKYKKNGTDKGFLEGHQHYNETDCPGKNMMAILGALRQKIDAEKAQIMAGTFVASPGKFSPVAVVGTDNG